MKIVLSVLTFLLLCASHSVAQGQPAAPAAAAKPEQAKIDPAKEKDIRQLLELTGAKENIMREMSDLEKELKPMLEQALPPGEYRTKLIDAFFAKFRSKIDLGQFVDMAVASYDNHFTHEEIKGLIQFYKTPLGQKTISVLPELTSDLSRRGQQWGQETGRTSMVEVLAEHPEFEKAISDAQGSAQPQSPKQ
jgi:hypothetical protein